MADSRTSQTKDQQAERERQSGERVKERQEAAAKEQAKEQDKAAKRAKSIDSGTITVVLRDESDQTAHDVELLVAQQGATVKSRSKGKLTVDLPEGSERNTGATRQRIVEHLDGSPLVEEVE